MEDIKQVIALTALNSMMQKSHFDICCIDSVAELLGVNPRGDQAYKLLKPLHCIDYSKMPTELRDMLPSLIQACLGIAPVYVFKTAKNEVLEVQPRGLVKRLLGG